MVRYAKIKDGKVETEIQTLTEIPQKVWAKKSILPIVFITESYEEGTEPERKADYYIYEDRVEKVYNQFIHTPTLAELKEEKIKQLKSYLAPKFPKDYKQLNSALGIYTEQEIVEIKNTINTWRDYCNNMEDTINACETEQELNDLDYRTEEDKAQDDILM